MCHTLSDNEVRLKSSSLNFISLVFGVSGKSSESISDKLTSLVEHTSPSESDTVGLPSTAYNNRHSVKICTEKETNKKNNTEQGTYIGIRVNDWTGKRFESVFFIARFKIVDTKMFVTYPTLDCRRPLLTVCRHNPDGEQRLIVKRKPNTRFKVQHNSLLV